VRVSFIIACGWGASSSSSRVCCSSDSRGSSEKKGIVNMSSSDSPLSVLRGDVQGWGDDGGRGLVVLSISGWRSGRENRTFFGALCVVSLRVGVACEDIFSLERWVGWMLSIEMKTGWGWVWLKWQVRSEEENASAGLWSCECRVGLSHSTPFLFSHSSQRVSLCNSLIKRFIQVVHRLLRPCFGQEATSVRRSSAPIF